MTNFVENFRTLIHLDPEFAAMFSSVKAETYGMSYIYNACVGCAVVLQDGEYYDVQDISVHEYKPDPMNLIHFNSFSSLENLVEKLMNEFEEEIKG